MVRKDEKAHGLQRRIEGPDVAGRRVLAVEDTSTTGGSVLTAVDALRAAGAEVVGVAVIVERGAAPAVVAAGLEYRAAYHLATSVCRTRLGGPSPGGPRSCDRFVLKVGSEPAEGTFVGGSGGLATTELDVVVRVPRSVRRLGLVWRRHRAASLRDSRFRQYGHAMGWTWDEDRGRLVGEVGGWPVSAWEDEDRSSVIALHTPAAMSPLLVRPRPRGGSVAVDHDGLTPLMTGDKAFDEAYEVRASEPWFALLVLSSTVRAALIAAPTQQWTTEDCDLVSLGPQLRDPLDLLARMAALTAVLESVPWEAYSNTTVPPGRGEVVAALSRREHRLRHQEAAALAQPD